MEKDEQDGWEENKFKIINVYISIWALILHHNVQTQVPMFVSMLVMMMHKQISNNFWQ